MEVVFTTDSGFHFIDYLAEIQLLVIVDSIQTGNASHRNPLCTAKFRHEVLLRAFAPFLTNGPNSFHFGKVGSGPGWIPLDKSPALFYI